MHFFLFIVKLCMQVVDIDLSVLREKFPATEIVEILPSFQCKNLVFIVHLNFTFHLVLLNLSISLDLSIHFWSQRLNKTRAIKMNQTRALCLFAFGFQSCEWHRIIISTINNQILAHRTANYFRILSPLHWIDIHTLLSDGLFWSDSILSYSS